ncbi:peptidase T [Lentiprolixibacter aurantiacus]|uniref:Peptidase T n=1 Tax=Lentiprolixibacter aurantiacus TaxID=2993939 RepID=A0AAE3MNE0_9FLAO|nr:peptidase T [Lentiprolixibacter aurantiacus]MCX2720501.1 peptidase T [Lentiprolixibacter aurantiacus]
MDNLVERFLSYVKIDTQSDPYSNSTPSTKKQWDLAHKLVTELKEIGMQDVTIDDKAYIMATLPANTTEDIPTIGFVSHFDTTPDFSGTNVNPRIIENYNGEDIVLNKEKNIHLSPDDFEDLNLYKGQTLIVTDGTTLLGADDKAGIAEIMTAMEYLIQNPQIKHGKIRVGFTPDEEIGRGAHHFDVEKFGADWAYTMDGSQIGELEYENFNAASAVVTAKGKSVHPGYAKDKMVNAIGLLQDFMSGLPRQEVPERTSGREGFFHIHKIKGSIEDASLEMIIRDHDRERFESRKQHVAHLVEEINKQNPGYLSVKIEDQYFNMKEKVTPVMHIVEIAKAAMKSLGITPIIKPIRGGTDGSQLSYMGLPCPNIFAGGHNFHGKYEYVPVESMEKAVATIVKICELTAERSSLS